MDNTQKARIIAFKIKNTIYKLNRKTMELKNEQLVISGHKIDCPAENGMRYIAVTPICNMLGIDHKSQKRVIKEHPLYSLGVHITPKSEGKETFYISLKFFFGWLFGINPNKVKPENKENLIKYQTEICNVLYEKFVIMPQFQKLKTDAKLEKLEKINELSEELKEHKKKLKKIEAYTYAEYKEETKQTQLTFDK